jgi:hypothetical protein
VQELGGVDTAGCGHRVRSFQKHCERSSRRSRGGRLTRDSARHRAGHTPPWRTPLRPDQVRGADDGSAVSSGRIRATATERGSGTPARAPSSSPCRSCAAPRGVLPRLAPERPCSSRYAHSAMNAGRPGRRHQHRPEH